MKNGVFALAIGILLAAAPARAGEEGHSTIRRGEVMDQPLTATEVTRYMEPYTADVRACFLRHARSGELQLDLIIHRDGSVFQLVVATPAQPRRAAREIDACVQKLATTWHFPVRMGFTHAVVPFQFLRITAPGAGPQAGCKSSRGCRLRR